MRVAYVAGTVAGGTGVHVAMLAGGCAAQGIDVCVFGPEETRRRFFPGAAVGWGAAARPGFAVVEIAEHPRPARDAGSLLRLRRLLRDWAPDVVHAHGLRAGAVAALALAGPGVGRGPGVGGGRPGRCPLLVTVHNAPPAGRMPGAVYAVLERIVARRADLVSCVSGDLSERMRGLGARVGGQALVPAPPPGEPAATEIARVRAELGVQNRPLLLTVGRLSAQKGMPVLLAAAARWQHRDPVPLLAIVGEGPLAGPLRAEASAGRLAVCFLGRRTDVPALMAAADVVVVASSWEGQPLVVSEVLLAGRPLVATRVGGIPDLTGEDGALLVPAADSEALAAAVQAVLGQPGLAASLAAAARARGAALPSERDAVTAAIAEYQRLARPGSTVRPAVPGQD